MIFQNKLPDYYPAMYLDRYTPEQILTAARQSILNKTTEEPPFNVKITSEVKIKK